MAKDIDLDDPSVTQFLEIPATEGSEPNAYADGGEISLDSPEVTQFVAPDGPISQPVAQPPQDSILDSPEANSFIAPEKLQAQYGTPSQQALAGLEGLAKGVAGPLATGAELGLGMTTPEAIRGRAEANPITHGGAEAAGFLGSAVTGVGEAAMLGHAAEAVGLGAKVGGSFINQVGQEAIKGAFETALFQGGEEIHNAFVQDPGQTSDSAIAHIGLAGVMGGVFGGALGAGLRAMRPGSEALTAEVPKPSFVSEMDQGALDSGDFRTIIEKSDTIKPAEKESILSGLDLGKQKSNAKEIIAAGKDIGAPAPLEGMLSDNHYVQKADNLLSSGVPTYSGVTRHNLYKEQYAAVNGAVEGALGEGSQLSKAQLGNTLKETITKDVQDRYAPIKSAYDELRQGTEVIPLKDAGREAFAKEITEMDDLRYPPGSPAGQLVRRVINDLPTEIKTVNDIKLYRTSLSGDLSAAASPNERHAVSVLQAKLKELETGTIESYAKNNAISPEAKERVLGLISQRKNADEMFKPYIKDLSTLSEYLGKGKVRGTEDALHFVNEKLTPEELTKRFFDKNDSEGLKFLQKKFPEQFDLMKDYQKGIIRENASKSGTLSPKLVYNQVNKLEPEIQKSLFSAEELSKLKSSETYLQSFPKDFNPSHTSDATAFRDMFSHGITGAASANLRDKAMELFIKSAGHMPEVAGAHSLAKSTIDGWNVATKGIKSIFKPEMALPASIAVNVGAREKLKKMVEEYNANPQKMLQIGANNPVPAYATAFAATASRAVMYLNSLKPNTDRRSPLDSKVVSTPDQIAKYNRALDLAQNPALILKSIKEGNVRPTDLQAIKTIYPSYYKQLANKLTSQMIETVNKGITIPYKTKMALSMFAAQPLVSNLQPTSIQSAQSVFAPKQSGQPMPSAQNNAGVKRGTASLNKAGSLYKTPGQASQEEKLKR